jgi:DNA-binding transcriptional regulator YdaS (Cro superfamily)
MELKEFVEPRGAAKRLAEHLGCTPVLISQWIKGQEDRERHRVGDDALGRPVPEDRAIAIEWFTGGEVRVETLCPDTRWHRVRDPLWPQGKPLIDRTPAQQFPMPPTLLPPAASLASPQPESV